MQTTRRNIYEGAAAGGVREKAEDEFAIAVRARWALKENLNVIGSAGACGPVDGVDYAK